ncbi:MAG: DNA replication/repair protein RecF [bacterium]
MYLTHLELYNYRNYKREAIVFHPHLNLIYGENAQGKSNLLESIFLLSTGKSPRTNRDQDLVKWEENCFRLTAQVEKKSYSLQIEITYQNGIGKVLTINGHKQEKLTQLLGQINVVYFSPDDLQLVKGGPSQRRQFLNLKISQTNPRYYFYLNQYRRVLQQRNKLLKEMRKSYKNNKQDVEIWNHQLIKIGSIITYTRKEAILKLIPLVFDYHQILSGGKEKLSISYDPSVPINKTKEVDEIEDIFRKVLIKKREEEIFRGITLIGPHRDDFTITINGKDGRIFGSQGQQRTAALSLKLAEMDYVKKEVNEYPIVLLDDVMSELDQERCRFILQILQQDFQTFITTTNKFFGYNINGDRFRIKQGTIKNYKGG